MVVVVVVASVNYEHEHEKQIPGSNPDAGFSSIGLGTAYLADFSFSNPLNNNIYNSALDSFILYKFSPMKADIL